MMRTRRNLSSNQHIHLLADSQSNGHLTRARVSTFADLFSGHKVTKIYNLTPNIDKKM